MATGGIFLFGAATGSRLSATGGTITTDGEYKVHTFNSSGTFTVLTVGTDNDTVEYLVIAGGGGGGIGDTVNSHAAGGGGAGGYRTGTGHTVTV